MAIGTVVEKALREQQAASHYPNGGFRHRAPEAAKWRNGQESVKTGLKKIQDALCSLPGYREAEQSGNREEQLRILGQVLQQAGQQRDYFVETGLSGLMKGLIDPPGRTGPKKLVSVSALLDFYSEGKRLDWFSPAYAAHLAANTRGRLVIVDRRQEWSAGSYGSKKAYEGTGLEAIVDDALAKYGLQNGVADFCYMFFSPQDALLANSRKERAILAYKLGIFLYMTGVIPRTLPDGEVRRLGPQIQDLAFMGYSYFANVKKRTSLESIVVDKPFSRLMMAIVKRATDPLRGGPSVEEVIDEVGSHPLIAQRYGRAVSYDDVLPVLEVMRRYQTGQRAVTIRIGSRSVQMTPETLDDFWVLNPGFIRLKQDMLLFYFWKRVGKGQWKALVNQALQRKRVIEYLGTTGATVTYEAIKSNPKAKFIKFGPLPSRELVRLGVLTAMPRQTGKGKAAEEPVGRGKTEADHKLKYTPRHAGWEEFRGYVPASQLAEDTFRDRLREEIRQKGAPNIARAVQLAEEVGFGATRGRSVEDRIRGIGGSEEYIILAKPRSDPKNPDEYIGLKKFTGEKGTPIKQVLYGALEQAIQELNPNFDERAVHQTAGGVVTVLQRSNIETQGDLEELLQKGWGAIKAVRGLVNEEPSKAYRLAFFSRACQIIGHEVPSEAIAASPLKYMGKDGQLVKVAFRGFVRQAVREAHPDWGERSVNQAVGGVISVFERGGIIVMPALEKLAQKVAQEGEDALQAVRGLVNRDPGRRAQLGYTIRALELAGLYSQTGQAAASEKAAAS